MTEHRLPTADLDIAAGTLTGLLAARVERSPDERAVTDSAGSWTFSELDRHAAGLAARLHEEGVCHGDRVLVYFETHREAIAGIVAVMRLGAAYVPVGPALPAERIARIVADCRPRAVLVDGSTAGRLRGADLPELPVATTTDAGWNEVPAAPGPRDVAWVLYTSGSTGAPRGVRGTHEGSVARIRWMLRNQPLQHGETCVVNTALGTVDSVWEAFGPLSAGNPLRLYPNELARDPQRLVPLLARERVRRICLVPSLLEAMLDLVPDLAAQLPHLALWVVSGEPLSVALSRRFAATLPHAALLNQYGLTETCADITSFDATHLDPAYEGTTVPIGRPFEEVRVRVVDDEGRQVRRGELWVAGSCLATGYLDRREDTAARFVRDQDGTGPWLRTGDQVEVLAGGELVHLGRTDDEVNLRGNRVALGDVEQALRAHPSVSNCAVVLRERPSGLYLAAFVVGDDPDRSLAASVIRWARRALPTHMVPAAVMVLEELPHTATGKIDRHALPAVAPVDGRRRRGNDGRTELERRLCRTVADVLGLEDVEVDDDFFVVGGDSLLALHLLARLRAAHGMDLTVPELFEHPTVAALVALSATTGRAGRSALATAPLAPAPDPAPSGATFPLSASQQRFWFQSRLAPDVPLAHVAYGVRLGGELDVKGLRRALVTLAEAEPLLRSHVEEDGGIPRWVVHPDADPVLAVTDLSQVPAAAREQKLTALATAEAERPFELGRPLWRVRLVRTGPEEHVLLVVLHHVLTDDQSTLALAELIGAHYRAVRRGDPPPPASGSPFAQEVARESAWERSPEAEVSLQHWLAALEGAPQALELPFDRKLPAQAAHTAGRLVHRLGPRVAADVDALASAHRTTPFVVLLAAFQVLIHRVTRQDDVVVGAPVANRPPEAERTLGCFMNTVLLRSRTGSAMAFDELLAATRSSVALALEHQRVGIDHVIRSLDVDRHLGRQPLEDAMFALRLTDRLPLKLDGLTCAPLRLYTGVTGLPLTLWADLDAAGLSLELEYADELFEPSTAAGLLDAYVQVLTHVLRDPATEVRSVPLVDPALDARQLGLVGPRHEIPEVTVVEAVLEQARRTPGATAVRSEDVAVTYQELIERSVAVADLLHDMGVTRGDCVGVCLERSVELTAALLGVMWLGAAYVPLDPGHPAARLGAMIADAAVDVVLTSPGLASDLPIDEVPVAALELEGLVRELGDEVRTPAAAQGDLAYVIYTSGSTGRPKGVEVEHRSLSNLLADVVERIGLQPGSVLLSVTTVSFDIAALELFAPLVAGGCVAIAPPRALTDGRALAEHIDRVGADVMQATPVTWTMLHDAGWRAPAGLTVLCGGEALPRELADRLVEGGATAWNLYGPTETTIWSTAWRVERGEPVSIGYALANTVCHVVGPDLGPCPIGVAGELLIGGAGVARGYRGAPDLTRQRFVEADHLGEGRLYRTGDLVRRRSDGALEFLGRIDQQFKLRGFRIEPAEIEAVLDAHSDVLSAVVTPTHDGRIAAHIVPSGRRTRQGLDVSLFFFAASRGSGRALYDLYLECARFADAAGFRAVWTPERHFDEVGGLYPNPSVLSAALASVTDRIHLRAGSVVLPLHDPIRVAEEWSVVDNLSGGRVGVALASGWHADDFVLAPDLYADRRDATERSIERVRQLWAGRDVEARNGTGGTIRVRTYPAPVQEELPLWLTSSGSIETFRSAGRMGTNVLTHLLEQDIDRLRDHIEAYRTARAEAGFDPETGVVTLMLHTFVAPTLDQARRVSAAPLREYLGQHLTLAGRSEEALTRREDEDEVLTRAVERYLESSLIGDRASCLRIARAAREVGVDELACLIDFGVDDAEVLASLPLLDVVRRAIAELPSVDLDSLRSHARAALPDHMVPTLLQVHDQLPVTANGKLDRAALAAMTPSSRRAGPSRPLDELETRVAAIWTEVLGEPVAHVDGHFFEMGGHSLLAARALALVGAEFGAELPLRSLFEHPCLGDFVADLRGRGHLLPGAVSEATSARRKVGEVHKPSPAHERLLFLDSMLPDDAKGLYNTPLAWAVGGTVDVSALTRAFRRLIERQPVLRTEARVDEEGGFELVVVSADRFAVDIVEVDPAAHIDDVLRAEAARPFALARDLPLRVTMLRGLSSDHLLVTIHHSVSDAWSIAVVNRELSALYAAALGMLEPQLPALEQDYFDHAARLRTFDPVPVARLAWWEDALRDVPEQLELPRDRPRPAQQSFSGATVVGRLEPGVVDGLRRLAGEEGSSMFMALVGLFATLLHRHSGQENVVIGTPLANRGSLATENLVGLLLEQLPLVVPVDGRVTFREVIARARRAFLDSVDHAVPFDRLVDHLHVARDLSRHPLMQVVLVMRDVDEADLVLHGGALDPVEVDAQQSKFDLTLWVEPSGDALRLGFEYATDLFDRDRIERMLAHFKALVADAVEHPDETIGARPLLTDAERSLIDQWNRTDAPFPEDESLWSLVEQQAARTPEAVAVEHDGERTTYADLVRRAASLADVIAGLGVGRGDHVGLHIGRSTSTLVALLGVLASGAAYVPLDPAYPEDRLRYMADDSAIAVVVTERALQGRDALSEVPALVLDRLGRVIEAPTPAGAGRVRSGPEPGDRAYVLYTSGSTGHPKGVMMTHRNAVSMLAWAWSQYSPEDARRSLGGVSINFDVSIFELLLALTTGGTVVLVANALAICDLPDDCEVTMVTTVPSPMEAILDGRGLPPSVRVVNLGGEPVRASLVSRVYAESNVERVYNLYGPTETTTYSTSHFVHRAAEGDPPIGRPIPNTRAYILDEHLHPVPIGVVGELFLAGPGVATGYLNRPDLTDERFVLDPFDPVGGGRMYATGDLARFRPDGVIDFHGRRDGQVKLHGHRIELGEIEAVLRSVDRVERALALVSDVRGSSEIVAYVVGDAAAESAVRHVIERRLPVFMRPATYLWLDRIPTTPNGKTDTAALPRPAEHTTRSGGQRPQAPAEVNVAAAWRLVLQIDEVCLDDSFFDVGGHSLLLPQLQQALTELAGLDLTIVDLFRYPTVRSQAGQVGTPGAPRPADGVEHREPPPSDAPDGHRDPGRGARRREALQERGRSRRVAP